MATLDDSSTWVDDITGIDNGDPLNSTELTTPEEQLAKRTTYLKDHASPYARSGTFWLPLAQGQVLGSSGATWEAFGQGWTQADTSTTREIQFDIPSWAPVTITAITVRFAGGAHSNLPADMPSVVLEEVNPLTGGETTVGTQVDGSGTSGAYNANHTVTLTVSQLVDVNKLYKVIVFGESGANALDDELTITGISVTWTRPADA